MERIMEIKKNDCFTVSIEDMSEERAVVIHLN